MKNALKDNPQGAAKRSLSFSTKNSSGKKAPSSSPARSPTTPRATPASNPLERKGSGPSAAASSSHGHGRSSIMDSTPLSSHEQGSFKPRKNGSSSKPAFSHKAQSASSESPVVIAKPADDHKPSVFEEDSSDHSRAHMGSAGRRTTDGLQGASSQAREHPIAINPPHDEPPSPQVYSDPRVYPEGYGHSEIDSRSEMAQGASGWLGKVAKTAAKATHKAAEVTHKVSEISHKAAEVPIRVRSQIYAYIGWVKSYSNTMTAAPFISLIPDETTTLRTLSKRVVQRAFSQTRSTVRNLLHRGSPSL